MAGIFLVSVNVLVGCLTIFQEDGTPIKTSISNNHQTLQVTCSLTLICHRSLLLCLMLDDNKNELAFFQSSVPQLPVYIHYKV